MEIGYSRHMTGDKSKFVSLDENKTGNVAFGIDDAGRIRGKGTVSLNNGTRKSQHVLFVDSLKHNLLIISQMCEKVCDFIFRAQDCEIRSTSTGKVLAKWVRNENNVYILKQENEEWYISKQDESWLWHRRLGHLNFDHIIKLCKKREVRDLPTIKKPQNTTFKSCQMGKQTRASFKVKDKLSSSNALQPVHIDLCEPSRT